MAAVYDDTDDQLYQGYPSQVRRRPTVLTSIAASVVTTVVVFFGLRELELRGYIASAGGAATSATATEVPNVVGLRVEQAREIFKARNLLISIAEEREDATAQPGSILSQNPLAGSEGKTGSTVEVILARASSQVTVPSTAGLTAAEAAAQLATKGLTLGPQKAGTSTEIKEGLVIGTDPPAETAVAPGTAVSLVVAQSAQVAIPKVVGRRLSQAKKALRSAGFQVGKTRYTYNSCCGEYVVLRQTPAEGESAPVGSAIDLVVNEPD